MPKARSTTDERHAAARAGERYPRPRRGGSAKSVLVTLLGEFVLPGGGAIWTGTVVDALALLGFAERNARQALARAGDDGLIEPERHGRKTRWHLTPSGRELLEAGTTRIYGFGHRGDAWDGRWLVVHCAVPETMRSERHQLHTQLSFEGFGFLSSTVAVSPHCQLEDAAGRIIAALELGDLANVFTASTTQLSPDAAILDRAWDLTSLQADYRSFLEAADRMDPTNAEERFTALLQLVNEWRRFPFTDPEFPRDLLPDSWVGLEALQEFDRCHARWSPDATTHYKEIESVHRG
jgi:phenylacetic acid degradation operon negative regulatory protein